MATRALFREDAYLRECRATVTRVTDEGVELDQTIFYPLGGGQAGDRGFLGTADGTRLAVVDARKAKRDDATPDDTLHVLDPASDWRSRLQPGTAVQAEIDWDRRHRLMRMHTCLHLLGSVLRFGVTGGQIAADKGRLDFDTQEEIDRDRVSAAVNAQMRSAA